MGNKYDIEIEITSQAKEKYLSDEYFILDLPVAPAIMVDDEIIVEGGDIDEYQVERAICKHLGLDFK